MPDNADRDQIVELAAATGRSISEIVGSEELQVVATAR
jgi:hypothetical protein